MQFAFDLISDLHVETWDSFDWTGQPTAPYCVVAGDVSRDPEITAETLEHLGQQYAGVFYIDGNDEHRFYLDNLDTSYKLLSQTIDNIPNVVYMHNNLVIINGVALLATNGWWSYDFDPSIDTEQSQRWYESELDVGPSVSSSIVGVAYHDAAYLMNGVARVQKQQDVKRVVVISHTVPAPWITSHDLDFVDNYRTNVTGNQHLQLALDADTQNKVVTWCFGHYHKPIDRYFSGIRFVSNPRGRGNTPWSQNPYFPKRIEIDI